MSNEYREICFDETLQLEAFYFEGISQKFPAHFHDYYMIGCIENGVRHTAWKTEQFTAYPGDFFLINPFDSHGCSQVGYEPFTYRAINISIETMKNLTEMILGKRELITFPSPHVQKGLDSTLFHSFHRLILNKQDEFEKEELFYLFMEELIRKEAHLNGSLNQASALHLQEVKAYIEHHFSEVLSLEELSVLAKVNKYTLIRQFRKEFGVTPYQYVQTLRIEKAKERLAEKESLISISAEVGFSDQSHFSRTFKNLSGVTPKQYQKIFH